MNIQNNIDKLYTIASEMKGYRSDIMIKSLNNIVYELNAVNELNLKLQASRLSIKEKDFVSGIDKMVLLLIAIGFSKDVILHLSDEFLKFICQYRKDMKDLSVNNIINMHHGFVMFYTTYDKYPDTLDEFKEYVNSSKALKPSTTT